jgi:hypothetical protein
VTKVPCLSRPRARAHRGARGRPAAAISSATRARSRAPEPQPCSRASPCSRAAATAAPVVGRGHVSLLANSDTVVGRGHASLLANSDTVVRREHASLLANSDTVVGRGHASLLANSAAWHSTREMDIADVLVWSIRLQLPALRRGLAHGREAWHTTIIYSPVNTQNHYTTVTARAGRRRRCRPIAHPKHAAESTVYAIEWTS